MILLAALTAFACVATIVLISDAKLNDIVPVKSDIEKTSV